MASLLKAPTKAAAQKAAEEKIKKYTKAHTIYKTSDGKRVPGATTITGLLDKPQLVAWANNLGLEGIDCKKYTDEAAKIGTLAHFLVQCDLEGMKPNTDEFSKIQMDLAENALLSYYEFKKQHQIEPILCEHPMVSDRLKFGGTVDCYCNLDGIPTLLDFKTGKQIYEEYFYQVSAYKELLVENGYPVKRVMILRIGRDETEGFETRQIEDTRKHWEIFQNLLNVYYLKKEIADEVKNKIEKELKNNG